VNEYGEVSKENTHS